MCFWVDINGLFFPTVSGIYSLCIFFCLQMVHPLFFPALLVSERLTVRSVQRTTSLGSMGSFDSNSVSLKSCNSGGLTDVSEHDQAAGAPLGKISTFPQSHGPVNYGGLDLFEAPVVPETVPSTAPPIDLFQLPETSAASVNMSEMSQASSVPSTNTYQPAQTSSPSSLNFFQITEQPSTAILNRNPQELSIPKNEGWATFDTPPSAASIPGTESLSHAMVPANEGSSVKSDQFPSSNTSMQWPAFQNSGVNGPSPSSDPWSGNLHIVQAPAVATSAQVVSAASDPWPGHLHNDEASAIVTNMQVGFLSFPKCLYKMVFGRIKWIMLNGLRVSVLRLYWF